MMPPLALHLDPRRSLASAIGWLVFALSFGLVLVANAWVGDIVRTNLLDQRGRQLERTAEHIVADLNLNLALRLQSVRALAAMLGPELREDDRATTQRVLERLRQAYPEFEWVVVADLGGRLLAATPESKAGASVADRAWFALGLKDSKIGIVRQPPSGPSTSPASDEATEPLINLFAAVTDAKGNVVRIVGTQLSRHWLLDVAGGLRGEFQKSTGAEAILLDADGMVLIGPANMLGKRWEATPAMDDRDGQVGAFGAKRDGNERPSRIERLVDGNRVLVARSMPSASDALHVLGWRIMVLQPLEDASARSRILQGQIAAVLLGLGLIAALLGALLARRITRGLNEIARSADAVRAGSARQIVVPRGRNEAARLGRTLDELLNSLQRERSALQTLNAELDQRVAARTREIERLAEQERHAAVVRERLKIARDLHDTLAHSMMAMLTEIRLLKRLSTANPGAMAEELTRAEEAAHQGLKEARAAIAQMRFSPVRDAGLAAALRDLVAMFIERSGIPTDFATDVPAGAYADERAEVLFRIAEEALHNVERHAGATHVTISLREAPTGNGLTMTITDNGAGFDVETARPGHYGLAGLREQALLIGADLAILSAPQEGTTIRVALPLSPERNS
jgi:signal transduction histidine kinase